MTREAGEASHTSDRIFVVVAGVLPVRERTTDRIILSVGNSLHYRASETNRRPEAALCSQRMSDRATFIGHSQT